MVSELNRKYYLTPPENLINEKVIPELLELALSILSNDELQSAASVSKEWNARAKNTAKSRNRVVVQERFADADRFVQHLASFVICETRKKALIDAANNRKSQPISKLSLLDPVLSELKEDLIQILKTFDNLKDLQSLVSLDNIPDAFKDIFVLSELYREADLAQDDSSLEKVILDFVTCGYFARAANLALRISNYREQAINLTYIVEKCLESKNVEEALKTGLQIQHEGYRSEALEIICNHLLSAGKVEEAKDLAETQMIGIHRDLVLGSIVEKYGTDQFDEAIKIIYSIASSAVRFKALHAISARLEKGDERLDRIAELTKNYAAKTFGL